jgi:curved DNA-binding protein CbpA
LFAILGVTVNASATDIKKAYHKLARDKHPDKHGNSEEAKNEFQEISTAWNILQKDDARNWYLRALQTEGPQFAQKGAQAVADGKEEPQLYHASQLVLPDGRAGWLDEAAWRVGCDKWGTLDPIEDPGSYPGELISQL